MKRKYHDKFNSAQRTMHQEKVYHKNPEPQKEYEKKKYKKNPNEKMEYEKLGK